jgi:hypothetical protein
MKHCPVSRKKKDSREEREGTRRKKEGEKGKDRMMNNEKEKTGKPRNLTFLILFYCNIDSFIIEYIPVAIFDLLAGGDNNG